ncbi:MAG: EAL domain-containing protein [Rhodocyclales bacterium]|nr:EAL domain-containing protein [Rhodocyclales bacterium]
MTARRIPHWSWLAAGIGALALLLVLAAGSFSDARRIALANGHLDALDEQQARLSENVLKLRYGLLANYDGINDILAQTQRTHAALGSGAGAIAGKGNARIDEVFGKYTAALNALRESVEGFKSGNAVLKNSLHFFPRAIEDIRGKLPPGSDGRELAERLADLYLVTLRYGVGADASAGDAVAESIAGIRSRVDRLPPPQRRDVGNVLAHAETILRYRPAVDALTRQIVFPETAPLVKDLYFAFHQEALAGERRADSFRLGLAALAGLLLVVVSFSLLRLMRSAQELQLAATVFEHSPYGITVTDGRARILRVNPAFCAITGYGEDEVAGKTPAVLKSGMHPANFYQQMWTSLRDEGQWKGELQNRRKNGTIYPEWLSIRAVRGERGDINHYVGIFSDLSEHKESERRLEYLANYDALTGLPNRVLFQDRTNQAIAHIARGNRVLALMYAGLDHFKIVNETLGVDIGDALLKAVAGRLLASLRETDTVCRLGGDQFAILLDDVRNAADVAAKAQALLRSFNQPFHVGGHELYTSLSIGVTLAPLDAGDAATLQRNADTAMFGAKEMGRNSVKFYSADMSARMAEALRLENGLRRAIESGELALHYQPQLCVSTSRVVCVEALLRWTSADFGNVPPANFIPVAEKCGLIVPIGEWVLRTACAQVAAWQRAGIADLRVAVNLSAMQFRQADLVDLVRRILAEHGLSGRQLELEITESVVMEDVERSIATLKDLRALGCEIAVDDFGTGYSSLNYLKQFPIDTLKIDQSFVRGLGSNADDDAVVNAIVSLGSSLSLKIVAEGVEHDVQRSFLENLGGRTNMLLQGYHICRPVPAAEALAFLSGPQR